MPANNNTGATRTRSLVFLLLAQVAVMTTWFATTASLAAMRQSWTLTPFQEGLTTSSVQAGFVGGTITSALLSAADRYELRNLFMISAMLAGTTCLAVIFFKPTDIAVPMLRFLTGFCLAGVYPVGMKIAVGWGTANRGLLVGLLVAGLTAGKSGIHRINRFPTEGLRTTIAGTIDTIDVEPFCAPMLSERLAMLAAEEAVSQSGLAQGDFPGTLFIAVPPVEMEWPQRKALAEASGQDGDQGQQASTE